MWSILHVCGLAGTIHTVCITFEQVVTHLYKYFTQVECCILTEWRRRKGRLKQRWMDNVYLDLREKGPSGTEMQNWAMWRQIVRNIDLT